MKAREGTNPITSNQAGLIQANCCPFSPSSVNSSTMFRLWASSACCRNVSEASSLEISGCSRDSKPTVSTVACCLLSSQRFRSEEHTSELQSHSDLVCRLLLEKKN